MWNYKTNSKTNLPLQNPFLILNLYVAVIWYELELCSSESQFNLSQLLETLFINNVNVLFHKKEYSASSQFHIHPLNQLTPFSWLKASQLTVVVPGKTIKWTFPQQLTRGTHSSLFVFWKRYSFYPWDNSYGFS